MLTTFVTIIFVIVCIFMMLVILLQAGRGGGMGTALGGGASQSVFGGGGGADFMAKLTQGFAATFMICALYLAYAGSHSGSAYLKKKAAESQSQGAEDSREIDYERLGRNPQQLPEASARPTA